MNTSLVNLLTFFWRRIRFIGKKERIVLDLLIRQALLVSKTIRHFQTLIEASLKSDWFAVKLKSDLVSSFESIADSAHQDATVKISEGAFLAGMREDFLQLMEKIDDMMDALKDAGRIMAQMKLDPRAFRCFYEDPSRSVDVYIQKIGQSVDALVQSLQLLESDINKGLKQALAIEAFEEEADTIKLHLINSLFANKDNIDVLTLLQLRDFILWLDNVADASEDASNIIVTLVAKVGA